MGGLKCKDKKNVKFHGPLHVFFYRSGLTSDDVNLCPAYIMGSLTQCAITIRQDW